MRQKLCPVELIYLVDVNWLRLGYLIEELDQLSLLEEASSCIQHAGQKKPAMG